MTGPRTPASIWHERVGHWRASGLTAHAYADQNNLSLERLSYWAPRIGCETRAPHLLPVQVRPSGIPTTLVQLQSLFRIGSCASTLVPKLPGWRHCYRRCDEIAT